MRYSADAAPDVDHPSLYAALRRRRRRHDAGGDLIVVRPGHQCLRSSLDRREDRERQPVHVDVLDQLVGGTGLEKPVHVQRAGRVGAGLARESDLNGDVRAQAVWRTGREYSAHAFDGLGKAVAVTEDGDEASQVLGGVARAVARDEPLNPFPGTACQLWSIRATETTAGPVIGRSTLRAPDCVWGRTSRHQRGDRTCECAGLRSSSDPAYHRARGPVRGGKSRRWNS